MLFEASMRRCHAFVLKADPLSLKPCFDTKVSIFIIKVYLLGWKTSSFARKYASLLLKLHFGLEISIFAIKLDPFSLKMSS